MVVKLLTEHHLEFLSLKGSYTDSTESTLVEMPHCWKSHVAAHLLINSTAWIPVMIECHLILTLGQKYWPQVNCKKLRTK